MGWTFTHRDKGITDREWFGREFTSHNELLDCATVRGSGFYAAMRNKETGEVWCLVVLTQWVPNDYHNFGYKDMSDTMGPGIDDCPARILDLLSPTDSEDANEWRERCRKNIAAKAAAKLADGTVVEFAQEMNFGERYGKASRFRYRKEGRKVVWEALTANGATMFRCRLGADWYRRDHTVLTPSTV